MNNITQQADVVLVDGSSYLYRAYHALPNLTDSAGHPTGAIYGVANMLRRLVNDTDARYFVVVFDAKGKTFRHERYPEYKANRPPMPDDLRQQIEPLLTLVKAMGLPLLQVPGVEADDVIGTLAKQAEQRGLQVLISTGDKDLAQLVSTQTSLVDTMYDRYLDPTGVEEKFGVKPELIIDYLSLTGDKVDNIPGVEKCGPKTAVKWLQAYGTLDGVIENADAVKGKIGEHLRNALPHLPLSKELVTIDTELTLDAELESLERGTADAEQLSALLQQHEFKSWLSEVQGETPVAKPEADYQIVLSAQELEEWLKRLQAAELFAFDTETTSIDPMRAEIVGLSFAIESGSAAYVPLTHDYPGVPQQLPRDRVLEQLKPILEDPAIGKVGQHLKYDINVLSHYGIAMRGVRFDTMLESYVFNATATRHDMDSLARKYLDYPTVHYEDIAGKGAKQLRFDEIAIDQAGPYAAEDADITLRLHETLWPQLEPLEKQSRLFLELEMPLVQVLAGIERHGVLVDKDLLAQQSHEFAQTLAELETQAHELVGHSFNLASPKQLQAILFEELGLPVIRKTPKGQPSTAEDVLQELAPDYELPELILQHRSLAKLKSTYTDKLPLDINPRTGRVHTSYHQAVAATGRLSSADPNLQNIPIRTPAGRRIRQAFVAPEGYALLAADYSQIELRIMAHLSGDAGLLKAFKDGVDVHRATAGEVFATDYDAVSTEQRRAAKAINFGLMYGMSAFGLGKQLHINRNEAQEYIDTYFARYPGVKAFMDQVRAAAHQDGYVETLFGRRLWLNEIRSSNMQRRQAAERAAINAPMQGTAADIIKRAMLSVDNWLKTAQLDAQMIMQVHDELVLEVAQTHLDEVKQGITVAMEGAANLDIPLLVDVGVGKNWDAAH